MLHTHPGPRLIRTTNGRRSWLILAIVALGCSGAPAATAPSTSAPSSPVATARATEAPAEPTGTLPPTGPAGTRAGPTGTPSATVAPAPTATAGLIGGMTGIFQTLQPLLIAFNPGEARILTADEVYAELGRLPGGQEQIDRLEENGLVERGQVALGSPPNVQLQLYRFVAESGATAEYETRVDGLSSPAVPCTQIEGAEVSALSDAVVFSCSTPSGTFIELVSRRADVFVSLSVQRLPAGEPTDAAVELAVSVLEALDQVLTP